MGEALDCLFLEGNYTGADFTSIFVENLVQFSTEYLLLPGSACKRYEVGTGTRPKTKKKKKKRFNPPHNQKNTRYSICGNLFIIDLNINTLLK